MPEVGFLKALDGASRLLMTVPLRPVQGDRFQPTGFPSLGAATYQTKDGTKLLVESAQSMANRLEATCWDAARKCPVEALAGISHVTVTRKGEFLTDSMQEAHRINSPYLLEGKDKGFLETLKEELGGLEEGPINRGKLAEVLLKYDAGSLIHGVFLAKKELAGGRLRLSRVLSSFIEASGVQVAASGGVKNDHVNPSGDTRLGFGNVPFSRDEFVAESVSCYFNLDLAQIRGYGLSKDATDLLILLALYRVRKLLEGDLRLRTACDLQVCDGGVAVTSPIGFELPKLEELNGALKDAIERCKGAMRHTTVTFEDELKKGKEEENGVDGEGPGEDGEGDSKN